MEVKEEQRKIETKTNKTNKIIETKLYITIKK